MRLRGAIGLAACAFLLAGCAKKGPPIVLSYGEAVPAGTAGAIEFPAYDGKSPATHVLAPVIAAVDEASLQPDSIGRPSIGFRFAAADGEAFRAWTVVHDRKPMALMLDGRVTTVATVHGPLPGAGLIEFGPEGPPSSDELSRIVDGLTRR